MMTKIEELPNINEINSINIEDTSNTNNQTTSDLISKQNLDNIHSIILDLDNNPFKHIIVQNEIECFYSQINNCSIKERLVLTTLINLIKSNIAKKSKFLTYNDLINKTEDNNINNENNNICDYNDDFNIDKKIFMAVERVTHKILHNNELIDGKNVKNCSIYSDLNKTEVKENENISYNNIDKLINNLKKRNNHKHLEFMAIKAIIIGIINLIEELVKTYLKKGEYMNFNYNIINEEYLSEDEEGLENNNIVLQSDLFETIFNDYVCTSNKCPFLENFFIESFNNFREKNQISFTLTELFTDIFWNSIFHNKKLCIKFITIYIGIDTCCDSKRTTLSKIIKMISDFSIPLRRHIFKLLSLTNIDNKDDIDLMTSIIMQKNINYNLIKNENIITNVSKKTINREYINIINNGDKSGDKNDEKVNIINDDKKKNENVIKENDFEHKSVDEVYNYINDINDNKEIKSKKKKRTKKKKNKKNEIKTINEEENDKTNEEDYIVSQFKKDINQDVISANEINKVIPVISDNWLKMISNK